MRLGAWILRSHSLHICATIYTRFHLLGKTQSKASWSLRLRVWWFSDPITPHWHQGYNLGGYLGGWMDIEGLIK